MHNFSKQFVSFTRAQGIWKEISNDLRSAVALKRLGHQHCLAQTLKAFE